MGEAETVEVTAEQELDNIQAGYDAIEEAARKEYDGEPEKKVEEKPEVKSEEETEDEEKKDEPDDETEKEPDAEVKDESTEDSGDSKEAEKQLEKDKQEFVKFVTEEYSKELSVPEDQVKDLVEKELAIAEKYQIPLNKDTHPAIKALRNQQKLTAQKDEELKKYHTPRNQPTYEPVTAQQVEHAIISNQFRDPYDQSRMLSREDAVARLKAYKPHLANQLDDDALFKEAVDIFTTSLNRGRESRMKNQAEQAKNKRIELIQNLDESYRRYIPEIKPMLDDVRDDFVLSEGFSLETYITQVKGKHFDEEIIRLKEQHEKELKEAIKRAKTSKKILAKEKTAVGEGSSPATETTSAGDSLSEFEKEEALSMYRFTTAEASFKAYKDHKVWLEERKKKK